MNGAIIGAVLIFAFTYYGIISKKIHRTIAAMGGAVGMIFWGIAFSFYTAEDAIRYIDFNTIGLLLGMMILVGILGETGVFRYLAIKTAKFSKGSYYRLLALFVLVTAFTSAFLDNVTTVLLMAPITITIAKELEINPVPFLISEILSSNIGGTMTLIGDPPNIMIGSAGNIHFAQFILYLAPIVIIVLLAVLLIFEFLFKDIIDKEMENFDKIAAMDEKESITNWPLLYKSSFALLLTLCLFTVHHILNLEPWLVAVFGASLLLILSLPDPETAMEHVQWTTLLFFAGLFIVIGGLEHAGLIHWIAIEIEALSGGSLVIALFLVLMISGGFAMAVGNIPAAIILVSVVSVFTSNTTIGAGYPINPLWWALSLGACFGGNGTLISAPGNIIVSNISSKMGYPLSFRKFTKYSLPITIFSLFLSFALLWLFYVVLLG
ncbi:MAG: ArsB/NhaD family transporter [Candidatus Thermoplasmatota archaeon]|nr:ArsB/NhaD family transporter [Candidatus Thermoplasmatota archaeon]